MAIRIVGVDLPQNKRGEVALTYVYGIGRSSSAKILDKAGVDRDVKVKDWTCLLYTSGYRIRKRSNHVTLFVDSKSTNDNQN